MKIIRFLSATMALILVGGLSIATADEGQCTYVAENMFAGPMDVCKEPVDSATCDELGTTDDNRDAVHSDGICPAEGLIGTCDLGDAKVRYYTGEASGLEIGCGFQGGDWITGTD